MSKVRTSLTEITTGYSVFEKDQVLTHAQLNSVADYFDDQTRLTRIKLLGVGIVCGLRVSVQGSKITVTKGAGVTTDGDLLYFAEDTVFDKFKLYDESNPEYAPFFVGEELIPIYELVAQGTSDERATDLGQFNAETETTLNNMVAVLLMEGYVKDEDLCSGTDCDNLGQNFVTTRKLLLLDKGSIGPLAEAMTTPGQAAAELGEILPDRPLLAPGLTSPVQLSAIYRKACNAIHARLVAELPKLYPKCSAFLEDVFATNPAGGWVKKLNAFKSSFAASTPGIQYYYDFLKNLAETWNHFHGLLFGDATRCCPNTESFPKHLLLGNVVATTNPDENRTGFYPSPLASRTVDELNHARYLAKKLDVLIQTFQVPASTNTIRITPSRFEDEPLEERAIPCYYQVNATHPIQKAWSYRLHRQGMDDWNYSYNAAAYSTQPAPNNPLAFQIGPFAFFRIEGHLGQNVSTAVAAIEAEIKGKNLPIIVQPVLLGTDKTKVVRKPGLRYSDLHRVHHVLRKDLAYQLEDVKVFSAHYAKQANDGLTGSDVDDPVQLKKIAEQKNQAIASGATSAQNALNLTYSSYRTNVAWKPAVSNTMTAAAEFRQNLGNVTKTEFATAFDGLIGGIHANLLEWLDAHIKDKEDKEDTKLLFSAFQTMHPGLEHFAGVLRGGTFVLVHDASNVVVADFMLPYHCCEMAEEESEPNLTPPAVKTPAVIKDSIKLIPSIDKYFAGKMDVYTRDFINPKINLQQDYFTFFKDSWMNMTDVMGSIGTGKISAGDIAIPRYTDGVLDASLNETKARQRKVDLLKEKAVAPGLPATDREKYRKLALEAENDLASSIESTAKYVSEAGIEVASGTEGFQAMLEISGSVGKLTDTAAKDLVKSRLTELQDRTGNTGLKLMLRGMTNF